MRTLQCNRLQATISSYNQRVPTLQPKFGLLYQLLECCSLFPTDQIQDEHTKGRPKVWLLQLPRGEAWVSILLLNQCRDQ